MSVLALISTINSLIDGGESLAKVVEYVKNSPLGKKIEADHQAEVAEFVAQAKRDYPNMPLSNAEAMENLKTMGVQSN